MTVILLQIFLVFCLYNVTDVRGSLLKFNPEGTEFVKHVNESFYINCNADNATDIWWYNSENHRISDTFTRVHVEGSLFKSGVALVFTSIQSADKGYYTCKAQVNNKTESLHFLLTTYKPISFRDTEPIQNLEENEPGVIRCDAEGEPEPTISWFVDGKLAEKNPRYKSIGDGLLIANVSLEDGTKDFVCRAAAVSSITSNISLKNIKLNILHAPKILGNKNKEFYGFVGGQINITCEVNSNPPANITWFKNNTRYFGDVNSTIFYEKNKSILKTSYIGSSSFAEYRCRSSNEKGSADTVFILKKIKKPEPPKKAKVHSTTHNSLQLEIHGSHSKEQNITGYKVQIMEREDKENGKHWEVAREVILPKGKPFIVNDLKPNTEYVIRVTSQNDGGIGDFTNEFKTKTLARASSSSKCTPSSAVLISLLALLLSCTYASS